MIDINGQEIAVGDLVIVSQSLGFHFQRVRQISFSGLDGRSSMISYVKPGEEMKYTITKRSILKAFDTPEVTLAMVELGCGQYIPPQLFSNPRFDIFGHTLAVGDTVAWASDYNTFIRSTILRLGVMQVTISETELSNRIVFSHRLIKLPSYANG